MCRTQCFQQSIASLSIGYLILHGLHMCPVSQNIIRTLVHISDGENGLNILRQSLCKAPQVVSFELVGCSVSLVPYLLLLVDEKMRCNHLPRKKRCGCDEIVRIKPGADVGCRWPEGGKT